MCIHIRISDKLAFDSLMGPLKELLDINMILRILKNLQWFENLSAMMIRDVAKAFVLETFQEGIDMCVYINMYFDT